MFYPKELLICTFYRVMNNKITVVFHELPTDT